MPGSLIICHKQNAPRALAVRQILAGLGVDVFVEHEDLEPGMLRQQQQEEALARHDIHFLFWSHEAARDFDAIRRHAYLAQDQRKRLVPVLLDDAPLDGMLHLIQPLDVAGQLSDEDLAVAMRAVIQGNRQVYGLRFEHIDTNLGATAGQEPELMVLRLPPGTYLTAALLEDALMWAAQERRGGPLLIATTYGAAQGTAVGELRVVFEQCCPPDTALILSVTDMQYREIPDKMLVQPGGADADRNWPVAAVWVHGMAPVYQVDLVTPGASPNTCPRLPVFRTADGFTFGVLSMAPGENDPDHLSYTVAGMFSGGVGKMVGRPAALDLCVLISPEAGWDAPAARRLLLGVGPNPVPCRAVISPLTGLYTGLASLDGYLEDSCVYRAGYRVVEHRFVDAGYCTVLEDGRLAPPEPSMVLRQLLKKKVASEPPLADYSADVMAAIAGTWRIVRQALLTVPEGRRQEIFDVLRWPNVTEQPSEQSLLRLVRGLAKLSLGGEVRLEQDDARFTAEWRRDRILTVLQGNENRDPHRMVGDFISRLQEDDGSDLEFKDVWVLLLDHLGDCKGIHTYKATQSATGFTSSDDLEYELSSGQDAFHFCSFRYLQSLLLERGLAGLRAQLTEVI